MIYIGTIDFGEMPERAARERLYDSCKRFRAKFKKLYGGTQGVIWFESDSKEPENDLNAIVQSASIIDYEIVAIRKMQGSDSSRFMPWMR